MCPFWERLLRAEAVMVLQLVEVFLEVEKEFDDLLGVDTAPRVEPHGRISPDGK